MMAKYVLDGHKYHPHLNYAWKTLDPVIFPTKSTTLDDCWVSITKKGTQTKESLYEFAKWIIQTFRTRGVEGEICGSHMVTSLGSASILFDGSRRIMWSFFPATAQHHCSPDP